MKRSDTFLSNGKRCLIIGLGISLFLVVVAEQAAGQKTAQVQPPTAPKASSAIPVAEVAAQTTEVSNLLRTLYAQFAPSRRIERIQEELPDAIGRMATEFRRTMKVLRTEPTLETLQSGEQLWQTSRLEMRKWVSLLTERATRLQGALDQLADLHKRWSQSLDSARAEQAPETIIEQITAVLPAIEAAQKTLQRQRSALLDLQGRLAEEETRCVTVLAEIIVPNSHLISEQVTNWTLSDKLRRIDLPVGVSYDAVPQKMIEVIEGAATAHPLVLKNPPPQALFVGFGDSSINFDLRVWTDQLSGWPKIRSELAVAVYDAVHAAGMSFPFPQREVRLLHDNEA